MKLLRNIFSKGQGTAIKVISLAIGLTVGLVLIAKVQLERNYNPCIVVGVMLGWYFSSLLLQQFADKVSLLWWIFVAVAVAVGIVIITVAYLQTRKLANSNPVNYLKNE